MRSNDRARQVDLAANFDPAGRTRRCSDERDGADGADVGGDVLAAHAVAARRAADQPAVLVGQRDAEAVDLQLGDVGDRRVAESPAPRRTRSSNARSSSSV